MSAATAIAGLAGIALLVGFAATGQHQSSDQDRMLHDVQQAITADWMPGDEDYDRIIAKCGPPTQQPGEAAAVFCRRLRVMYREAGADVTEMDCAVNGTHYPDAQLSPRAATWEGKTSHLDYGPITLGSAR